MSEVDPELNPELEPESEQLTRLKLMLAPMEETVTDNALNLLLDTAKMAILNKRYPYGIPDTITDLPARWNELQLQIAVELFNKRGAEGEMSHSSNGITRSWEAGAVSASLLRKVTPVVGGVTKCETS